MSIRTRSTDQHTYKDIKSTTISTFKQYIKHPGKADLFPVIEKLTKGLREQAELLHSSSGRNSPLQEAERVEKALETISYPHSLKPDAFPEKTKTVALAVLSGKSNPFENPVARNRLGSGDFGRVERVTVDSDYARKTLKPNLNQTEFDFSKEYKNLMAFDHPNIVKAAYINKEELYMEYINGVTFASRLDSGDLNPIEILNILLQVTSALSYMHSKGYFHNDPHAGNILVTKGANPTATLIDLGLTTHSSDPKSDPYNDTKLFGELLEGWSESMPDSIKDKLDTLAITCKPPVKKTSLRKRKVDSKEHKQPTIDEIHTTLSTILNGYESTLMDSHRPKRTKKTDG